MLDLGRRDQGIPIAVYWNLPGAMCKRTLRRDMRDLRCLGYSVRRTPDERLLVRGELDEDTIKYLMTLPEK